MSDRKFTRLKQSLSQTTGTAAKARETVSRELRQSTLSPGMDSHLSAIDSDYERSLREWNADLKQKLRDARRSQETSCNRSTSLNNICDSNNSESSKLINKQTSSPNNKNNNKNNKKASKSNDKNHKSPSKNDDILEENVDKNSQNSDSVIDDSGSIDEIYTPERLDLELVTQYATPEDDIQVRKKPFSVVFFKFSNLFLIFYVL